MSSGIVNVQRDHPVFGKLFPCYSLITSQCASKHKTEKSFDLSVIEDVARRLTHAIQTDAKSPVPTERFLALLTYIAELSWNFLYRTTEICGPENSSIKTFQSALMKLQCDYILLPCTKGIEMSTRCLIFAARASKLDQIKDLVLSWELYFAQETRPFSLQELQRIVLFYCECSTNLTALSLSDDNIYAKWDNILPMVLSNCSVSHSWTVLQAVVEMEIRTKINIRSPSAPEKKVNSSRTRKNLDTKKLKDELHSYKDISIDSLIAVIHGVSLEEMDAIGLELLSRAINLAVQVEAMFGIIEGSLPHNSSSTATHTGTSSTLLESVRTFCARTCSSPILSEKALQDVSKYVNFLARMYSSCLNWLQKHHQDCKMKEKQPSEVSVNEALNIPTSVTVLCGALQSLSVCSLWCHAGPHILGTLRAMGNCLTHLPVWCFEGTLGAVLCSSLSECVCSLLGRLPHIPTPPGPVGKLGVSLEQGQEIASTCVTLASLVGGKCMARKLFASCAQLSASVLLSADKASSKGANTAIRTALGVDPGHPSTPSLILDSSALNRVLFNLCTACSLGYCDADAVDITGHAFDHSSDDLSRTGCADIDGGGGVGAQAIITACYPVLQSTYAEDFLFSVSTDIQHRVGYVTSDSFTVAADFVTRIFRAASANKLFSEDLAALLMLHFKSHCLWGAAVVPGASDVEAVCVIRALKALGDEIDPLSMDTVAIVRGKSRIKRVPKGEQPSRSIPPPIETIQTLAGHLRVWVMLALWGLPMSTTQSDICASDGSQGVSEYLSNAFRSLKGLAQCISELGDLGPEIPDLSDVPLSVRLTLSTDCKALFHILSQYGRLREQNDVSKYLAVCGDLFLSPSLGPKSQYLKKEYHQILQEMLIFNELQCVWRNEEVTGVKHSHIGGMEVSNSSRKKSTLGHPVCVADAVGQYLLGVPRDGPGPLIPSLASRDESDVSVWKFIEMSRQLLAGPPAVIRGESQAHSQGCSDTSASVGGVEGDREGVRAFLVNYESAAENLLLSAASPRPGAGSPTHTTSQPPPPPLSASLRAWMALLAAKTILCASGDHQKAYKWARKALSYIMPRSADGPKRGPTVEGASSIALDRSLPRLEGILLCAELYEQTGNTDSCLSYFSEATAIAKVSPSAMKSIVALHSMRVWHRMHSARFVSALHDLGDETDEEYSLEASRDEVSKKVRAASRAMAYLLRADEPDYDSDSESCTNSPTQPPQGSLSYRYLDRSWDFNFNLESPGPSSFKSYHTTLCVEDRALLLQAAAECTAVTARTSKHTAVQQLLGNFRDSKAFDALRDIRRMACLQSLSLSLPRLGDPGLSAGTRTVGKSFSSFLLGASSCGTAMECTMDRPGSSPNLCGIAGLSRVIGAACCGDAEALSKLEGILKRHVEGRVGGGGSVCFAVIEPSTKDLMIGRCDSQGTSVVTLPVADQLSTLLGEWQACMDGSKALLHRTLDSVQVAKWTDDDKRAWWAERTASDALIGSLLVRLQNLLGSWTHLLSDSIHREELHVDDLQSKAGMDNSSVTAPCPADDTYALTQTQGEGLSGTQDEQQLKILNALKVTELRQLLKDFRLSTVGKKSELVTRLQEHSSRAGSVRPNVCMYEDPQCVMVRSAGQPPANHSGLPGKPPDVAVRRLVSNAKKSIGCFADMSLSDDSHSDVTTVDTRVGSPHTVLILDESLQQIPWEVLPCLRTKPYSRVPSLALLLHMLTRGEGSEHGTVSDAQDQTKLSGSNAQCSAPKVPLSTPNNPHTVDPELSFQPPHRLKSTWYALDPEGNLPATRETMSTFLQPYVEEHGWAGFVGQMPTEIEAKGLHNSSDLFVYCGHGAGDKICDSHKMRKWRCPSAMLWGCSSGRLTVSGVHDPQGPALNYLVGGAKYVIANLWDVTDKDIDKLSMECMRTFFGGPENVLDGVRTTSSPVLEGFGATDASNICPAGALASSRAICKLKNAVGCAPVVYGLPKAGII